MKKGFTLVETLFALAILSTALLLIVNAWSGAFIRIEKAQVSFEVASLLERKMSELEQKYAGKPLSDIPEEPEEGDFGEQSPQYKWKVSSQDLEFPNLTALLTAKDGGADPFLITMISKLTDAFSKSIKEVTLTIIYKKGKIPVSYSITRYFIDYDKPIDALSPQ